MAKKKKRRRTLGERFRKKYVPKKPKQFKKGVERLFSRVAKRSGSKKKYAGPGRPRLSYKHRHPRTGQPIPATTAYKIQRAIRRRQQSIARQMQRREVTTMARRGVPPKYSRQVIQRRFTPPTNEVEPEPTQMHLREQMPMQEYHPQQQFRVVTDIMTGRKILKPIPQVERWVRS